MRAAGAVLALACAAGMVMCILAVILGALLGVQA